MKLRHLVVGSLVAAFGIAVAVSCSLRYDFTECNSDSDCYNFDDPENGTFYTCGADDTCQPVDDSDFECRNDEQCGTGRTCNRENQCIGGMTDAGDTSEVDAHSADCETTTECRNRFDENHVCIENECRDVTTEICSDLYFPADDEDLDDVVLLGSLIPETGSFETVGEFLTNAVELAVKEFDGSGRTTLTGKRVGWLQCATEANPQKSVTAAEHLVDLGVPAIVGPIRSGNYLKVVEDVTGDAETVTIAPTATSPSLTNLEVAGTYSFRVIGNDRFQAQALLDRLKNLLEDRSDVEITVFWKEDQYGTDFKNQFVSRVNEGSWLGNKQVGYFMTKAPNDTGTSELQNNFNDQSRNAVSNQPNADVAVFLGTGEMAKLAATYIRAVDNESAGAKERRYIFSHGAVTNIGDLPSELSGEGENPNETFLPLTEGVTPNVVNRSTFENFSTRYNIQFQDNLTTSSAGVAYDAAVLALLGMTGVPESESVTGSAVKDVIAGGRLQNEDGERVVFTDPSAFGDAKSGLRGGGAVDIDGVSGGLDLNENGDVRPNYLGTETGITFDVNEERVYDIIPARLWKVDEDEVAGSWSPLGGGFVTDGVFIEDTAGATIPESGIDLTRQITTESEDCSNAVVAFADIGVDIDHPAPENLRVRVTAPATEGEN
jgi:branched-chain amino acid transport system substrate-binding protein